MKTLISEMKNADLCAKCSHHGLAINSNTKQKYNTCCLGGSMNSEESRFNFYLANNKTAKKGCSYFNETNDPIALIEEML